MARSYPPELTPPLMERPFQNAPLSRRLFLGGAVATGMAVLGAKAHERVQQVLPSTERRVNEPADVVEFSEPHPQDTPWERKDPRAPQEQNDLREMQQFRTDLARFQRLLSDQFPDAEGSAADSLEMQSAVRAFLLQSSLPEKLSRIAPIIARSPSGRGHEGRSLFQQTLQIFSSCNGEGLVYAAVRDAARAGYGDVHFARDFSYYSSRLRDYVPTKKDIWSQDIDPRNRPDALEEDRERMRNDPAWSGKRRKEIFRTLATRPSLVERAQRDDLTLVEFFSLIKSIVHERGHLTEEERARTSIETTADELLAIRRELLHRKILGPETEHVILFYGDDHARNMVHGEAETVWDGPLEAAGVRPERIEKISTSATRRNADALRNLHQSIASSRGKTFLSFKTHGATDKLMIDSERGSEHISDTLLAQALIARIQATRNPKTLEDMDIVVDACHSYEFRNNVIQRMEELWQRSPMRAYPFDQVGKPFFVTVVQEGSVGQGGSLISGVLDSNSQVGAIRKDGGLYVERLLKNIQPRVYEENDMTFFGAGRGREFAGRASSQRNARAA